jgi:hypothetical protein
MENYCVSCGRYSRLVAFWYCQGCLDRFYDRRRRGAERRDRARIGSSVSAASSDEPARR